MKFDRPRWLLLGWQLDIASLLAGAAVPLAFSPFNLFPIAVISPAILFIAWLMANPRQGFRRGYLFGLGMFAAGVSWVYVSIYGFGGVSFGLSIFLTSLFVLFLALFPALLGYLVTRFFKGLSGNTVRLKLLIVFPAAWVLFEWVRGWFLTGFPWLNLGYSQIDSPLGGFAPLAGVYGVSWTVVLTAGLVAALVLDKTRLRLIYVAGLLSLWIVGFGLGSIAWTSPAGQPLKVSLIQGNIPQDMKWAAEVRAPTIELYTDLTRQHWDSDLIIWPESALPDFYHNATDYLDEIANEARVNKTDLLVGVLYMDPQSDRYYNSVVSLGRKSAFYHKRHLVPFTEYLPLKGILGSVVDFMQVPMSDFSRGGDDQQPLEVAGQKAGIAICYEDAFGEELISFMPQATILVNVSNDAWFGESIAPQQHLQIARMRALETGRPLLRGTNNGLTAVIKANGQLQSMAPQFQIFVLTDTVQPMQGMTPYAQFGNWPIIMLLAVLLVVALVRRTPEVPAELRPTIAAED